MANGAPCAHHGDTDAHRHPALDHDQAIDPAIPRHRSRLMAGAAPCQRSLALAGVHLACHGPQVTGQTGGRVCVMRSLPTSPHHIACCVTVPAGLGAGETLLDPGQRGEYPQALVDDGCMLSLSRGARHGCHPSILTIIFTCALKIRRPPSSSFRRCLIPPLWSMCNPMASPPWIPISTG